MVKHSEQGERYCEIGKVYEVPGDQITWGRGGSKAKEKCLNFMLNMMKTPSEEGEREGN